MQRARLLLVVIGLSLGVASPPASAFDNLEKGKSAAELYKTNCALCHRTPRGLGAAKGAWSLSGFLVEHYTTSKSAASLLAGYLQSINKDTPERPQRRSRSSRRKSNEAGGAGTR